MSPHHHPTSSLSSGVKRMCLWLAVVMIVAGQGCAEGVSAAEGEFPLRECNFMGDHSSVSLSHRSMSQYAAYESDKAQRASVTVFVKPGEIPHMQFSGYPDPLTVERQFGRGTDKMITVDGGTWEGPPSESNYRVRGWKVPVKPGWNNVTVRVTVLSNKQRVGELQQSFRIFAYVFEVQPAGQLEHPLPGETGNFFLEHPLVDAVGNLYVHARRGRSGATLRYDRNGRISVRYEINPSMAGGYPFGVDEEGNLYALIAENIIKFNRTGKFVRSVASLGSIAATATAEDLKTGNWPSRTGADRRAEVLRHISACASHWETAMVGDAMYFIAHTSETRSCSDGPHVLAMLTLDGRAQVLDKVDSASGVIRGTDGNLYIRERGKSEANGMLIYSPTGRLEERRPMIGSLHQPLLGMDGAGYFYGGGHAWEPSLTKVKESTDVADGRFRSVSQARGPSYYQDLLTGELSTSNVGHHGLASWMYRGAVYTVYNADLRIARAVSLAPGAANVAPPAMLKGGRTGSTVTGATPTQQNGTPEGKTGAPTANQPPSPSPFTVDIPGGVVAVIFPDDDNRVTPAADDEVSPGTTAVGTLIAGGITALGTGLMMLGMGVTPKDLIDGVHDWFGGTATPTESPPPLPPLVTHRDGDVNELGEVWSDEDRGWIGRNLYEEEKARRTRLADKAVTDLESGQSEDVKKAHDTWLESKERLNDMQSKNRELDRQRRIEHQRDTLKALEAESGKGLQSLEVLDTFMRGVEEDVTSVARDAGSGEVWKEFGGNVQQDAGELWRDVKEGAGRLETYTSAGKAVLHSAKGMAEGMATLGKMGLHVIAHPIDTTAAVMHAGSDPLAAIEFVSRAGADMVKPIVDHKKSLAERLQGVAKLELEAAMGEAVGLGMGRVLGATAELTPVKNLLDKMTELKSGIFGEAAGKTGQRIHGTGQTVGREAEQAALARLPADHPLRKVGEINEAAAKAGAEFNPRLVKGDRLLDVTDPAYRKGMEALKTDPKYLTPEARKVADSVRYDQHLRAQQQAMKDMLADHPEFKGHIEGVESTGSHAWKRSDYKPGRSDIDLNARGDGTAAGRAMEETFPEYYRKAVGKTSEASGVKLTPEDLKANCYGDGKAQGALKSDTGEAFVESYRATGKGRLDVYDENGNFTHSLDGKDPLLGGDRKFFDNTDAAAAAGKAKEFHADVAAKHFEETAGLSLNEKLRQGAKNVKTIGNVSGKFTRQPLPEPLAKLVKNPSALKPLPLGEKQNALALLENYLRQQ